MSVYDHPEYYDIVTSWDIALERDFILSCISHHSSRPVKSLLDVACGSGRLAREFSRLGMQVTGIDKCTAMVEYAARRGGGEFLVGDMGGFELGRRFDTVICMLDSLAHIGNWDNLAGHLASVRRHLEDGGVYVVDFVVATGVKENWRQERDGTEVTCYYESSSAEGGRYRQKIAFVVRRGDGAEERIENEDDCPELDPGRFNRLAEEAGLSPAASFCEHDLQKPFAFGEDRRHLGAYVAV